MPPNEISLTKLTTEKLYFTLPLAAHEYTSDQADSGSKITEHVGGGIDGEYHFYQELPASGPAKIDICINTSP